MEGITTKVEGGKLVITCDLASQGRPSSTGKTRLIASTHGALAIPCEQHNGLKLSLNLTVPN